MNRDGWAFYILLGITFLPVFGLVGAMAYASILQVLEDNPEE